MFTNSIRWRLQIWIGFLLLCVLSALGITAYHLQKIQRFLQIDQQLETRVSALSAALRRPPGGMPSGRKMEPWEDLRRHSFGDGPEKRGGPDHGFDKPM